MNNRVRLQKLTAFFLVFIMLLGIVTPDTAIFAEGKSVETAITDFKITDKDRDVLDEGSTFEKDLSNNVVFSDKASEKFDTKSTDGEVKTTLNDFIEDKDNIDINLSSNAKEDEEARPVEKETESTINSASLPKKLIIKPEEQADKNDNKAEVKDSELSELEENINPVFLKSLMSFVRLTRGIPMGNGKLVVYDDSHKINDLSNGDGTSVNEYNLATMTDTLFTINYTPFFHVKDDGSNEFGDQRIVVEIPTYGFKLANPGIEGVQLEKITMLDARGNVIPLDPIAQKNYDKVVKIIYDINDNFLSSLGGSGSLVFNIAFNRRSLTAEECAKWLNEGKLVTNLNVSACEGDANEPINSIGNPSEYKWRMSPINYEDPKTTVTGDRHLNASSMAKIANSGLIYFYDADPASGPFTGNRDYYYYKQGTIHDANTPLMSLKHIKVYVPKTANAEGNFILQKLQIRNGLYDLDLAYYAKVSEMKNDGDGKGNYYLITPRKALYNNGSDHKWTDAFTNGFSPIWQVPDGIENIGSDTLYEATTPEFVFETPNGTDGKKEVTVSADGQGVKIKTMKANTVDGYEIHTFSGAGYQLYKNAGGFYTANAVSPDATYTDVGYTRLSNEYYILKDANGEWNEYFPKNKTGATVETFEFPEEIQPTAWTGTAQIWDKDSYKVAKVVYTTADGNEHTVDVNSFVYLANQVHNFPKVNFDTSAGRVTKVNVYWEHLNNERFNARTHFAGKYNANTRRLSYAQSKFDYYVIPTATGHLQVKYSAKSTDPSADENDNFDYEADKIVRNPVNNLSRKAKDDFFWTTVTQKKCTPLKAESTGERLRENVLYPNQAENGTFYDTWMLFFDYGTKKEFSPITKNPKIDLTVGTLNLKGLDTKADKTGLMTGKFTANKALSGWKIIYKTVDNLSGTESAEKVYNIGNIEDGTRINLGIDRSLEHLSSIVLTYDGVYNIETFVNSETGRTILFSNIEYELRNTDFKGNPLTIERENGLAWYGPNYFIQNLEGKYYNGNCSDVNHVHDAGKGQTFGGRAWNFIKAPQRYGLLTRTYIITNKTVDNVIEPTGHDTINSISQSGTSLQKVRFNTKAYAYAMNSDMPEAGKMPYGIPESAYVEITDRQFSADVDKCKFLGYDNASGNVEIKQVKDADGKVWIKMSITDAGIRALNRQIREITKNRAFSYYYYYNDSVLKFMEDPIVIALKSFKYTSVTSPGENEHHPYGMVYYDMSQLESKLDGSKKEYYSHAKLEGDLFQLSANAANALNATKEKKLFGLDLSRIEVVVSKNTAVGTNIFPGKYDDIVYGTAGSKFPTQTFYSDEIDNLRGDFFVQVPDSDGFKDFKAIIEIPKKDKTVSYTQRNEVIQTPKTKMNMYLTGKVAVMGDSRPGKQEFTYSIDGGNTFVPAENVTDWSQVTHVKLDLGELPKGSQVSLKLPLKTHAKTTTDNLEAYLGGRFEMTDHTGFQTNGYINPAKYIYGHFSIRSSDVWWDKNENGKLDNGEIKAKDIKVELYSPNHNITINNNLIPANTLIHSTMTDENGRYELKSFMLEAGQWIKVTMPNSATKLTLKAEDADILKQKNSDFDRISYRTPALPELVREKPLDTIGCGLIHPPKIKTKTVKLHVGEESNERAAQAVATSDHPTVSPELDYLELQNDIADVDDRGKVRGKMTGKIKAIVKASNTLASDNQAIPEDTTKAEYDIIVYGKVNYNKNHADVNGEAPKDNNEYYPSVTVDGNDADTDKVTVLDAAAMRRSGYLFKGWNTQADGRGIMYSNGDVFKTGTIDKDVELYAIWSLIWTPMEIPTRDLKVTKTWELPEGRAIPVNEIEVELFKDNVSTGKKLTLNEANNWMATFEKLPVSATLGGANHKYTVKEVGENAGNIQFAGKWYGVSYDGTMADGFTVTNKEKSAWTPMVPPTRNIKVTKAWKDIQGNALEAPVESVEVELYKDGVATGKKLELTKDNNWEVIFERLEVADGLGSTNYYQYTIKEVGETSNNIQFAGKWYEVSYDGTMADGFTVTNKEKSAWTPMIPPTRNIKVTKAWKDIQGNALEAPVESIEVELYKDGVATSRIKVLNRANNWMATFETLPVSATLGGANHQYTIKEVGESSNNIQLAGKWYEVSYDGTMVDGFTVTNKEKSAWTPMIPPTRNIKVTKAWKDIQGNPIEAPVESIEVELYKNGVATGKKLELTKYNNWKVIFEGLEVADGLGSTNYYQYTVKEVGETSNNVQLVGKWYGVTYTGTMVDGFIITNKEKLPWTPMNSLTRDIKVIKAWKDIQGNPIEAPVEKIEVELYKDGVATSRVKALNRANNWMATFEDLPVSATLGGANHQYTIKEIGENSNNIQLADKWYEVNYDGTMTDGFTVTNKEKNSWTPMSPQTRNIKATKVWKDSEGNPIEAPVEKIEVELYKDGVATSRVKALNRANNWMATFEALPVSATLGGENHQYTIKEIGESSNNIQLAGKWYEVNYDGTMTDGFTVTNKEKNSWTPMSPQTRNIKATKVWKDSEGNPIEAPVEKIEVELYKDGVATSRVKALNRENNWMATFELLPVSATLGGANHQYTIKEVGETANTILIDGEQYQVVYGGSMEDGFSITNQKEMPTKLSTSVPNNLGANKPGRANTNISNNKTYIAQKMKHATMVGVVNKSSNKVLPKTGGGESNTSHQYVWLMLLSGALLMLIGYRCKTKCRRNKE